VSATNYPIREHQGGYRNNPVNNQIYVKYIFISVVQQYIII